jgi:hypothetical protein
MGKLIQEAEVDDRFNTQMKKVQDAASKLDDIIDEMKRPGSMTKPVASQKTALRNAAKDFERLSQKVQ